VRAVLCWGKEKQPSCCPVVVVMMNADSFQGMYVRNNQRSRELPPCTSPHTRSCSCSTRARTISARKQLLTNRGLRIRMVSPGTPSRSHPTQTQPQLVDRLCQPSSSQVVMPSELLVPAAILELDAPASLAGFTDDADPSAGDLFVRVFFC
jgi:hypothetical protein